MEKPVDVVVVGAGPVGLLTAIELALGGVRVLVLERLATASMTMKAGGSDLLESKHCSVVEWPWPSPLHRSPPSRR
jgi:2-polyprenyl-6-methoxyphenol hydroxylase-like FAD-dependent oxidoreductase